MPSNFEEVRFPKDYSYGATVTRMQKVNIVQTVNSELRDPVWFRSRKKFDISHMLKVEADKDFILNFWELMQGPVIGFRFKDWTEYQVKITEGIANVDGLLNDNDTSFQLYKKYSMVGISRFKSKPIYKLSMTADPVSPAGVFLPFKVYKNAVEKTSLWTVDPNTGVVDTNGEVLFDSDVITWQGEFDYPVRFSDQQISAQVNNPGAIDFNNIVFEELRTLS